MGEVQRLDQRAWRQGDSAARREFAAGFRRGVEAIGFVVVEGHGVAPASIDAAFAATREFFSQTREAKARVGGVASGQRGYTGFGVEHAKDHGTPDLKEFFHVGRDWPLGHPRSKTCPPNLWPETPPGFAPAMRALFAALDHSAADLFAALELAYEVPPGTFSGLLHEGNSILRALHYPPLPPLVPAGAFRAAPHEDINLITLLCEATEPGLEVRTASGWEPVIAVPGSIVVDAGDMLHQVTGGVIPSTTHRVVTPPPDRPQGLVPVTRSPSSRIPPRIVTCPSCRPSRHRSASRHIRRSPQATSWPRAFAKSV